jgi:hypothetical protein
MTFRLLAYQEGAITRILTRKSWPGLVLCQPVLCRDVMRFRAACLVGFFLLRWWYVTCRVGAQ